MSMAGGFQHGATGKGTFFGGCELVGLFMIAVFLVDTPEIRELFLDLLDEIVYLGLLPRGKSVYRQARVFFPDHLALKDASAPGHMLRSSRTGGASTNSEF